jgi:putative transposase
MKTIRGFKTELSPNNKQSTALLQHAGCARFAFNWGLGRKIEARERGEKNPSAIDLHKELNILKKTDYPWLYMSSKSAPQEALRDLDQAFKSFFRRCKQNTRGKKGFPKFKSKHNGVGSFRIYGAIRVRETHVKLPKIGWIILKEHEYLPTNVKILFATMSEKAGRWFVSLNMEIDNQDHNTGKDRLHPLDQ